MADKSELQHLPNQSNSSLVLSEARTSLIARGRKDIVSLQAIKTEVQSPITLMDFDFLMLDFDRRDIEAGDTSDVLSVLKQLLDRDAAIKFCEKVDLCCTGYEDDPRELYEIPEVRVFAQKLDSEFPYWCYFLSREGDGLLWFICCLYPSVATQEERRQLWPLSLTSYAYEHGIPYMNAICRFVGCTDSEVLRLTKSIVDSLVHRLTTQVLR